MDFGRVCRLCGKPGEKLQSIFEKEDGGVQIFNLIKQHLPVLVYRTDPLPKTVCEPCLDNLIKFCSFLAICSETHESFKAQIENSKDLPRVQLYLNALDQENQVDNNEQSSDDSLIIANEDGIKLSPESIARPQSKRLRILSPDLINSQHNDEPEPYYRPGPRSKTRPPLVYQPCTLAEYARHQLNTLRMQVDEGEPMDGDGSPPDSDSLEERLLKARKDGLFDDFKFNAAWETDPTFCNLCRAMFPNLLELAKHEITHMKADLGPRVDEENLTKNYFGKDRKIRNRWAARKKFSVLYNDSSKQEEKVDGQGHLVKEDDQRQPGYPGCKAGELEMVNDGEIVINGIPIMNIEQALRRSFFKTIVHGGVKCRFCPICRNTFKDNWSIELHYRNGRCYFLCRFCGTNFDKDRQRYIKHMASHANEGDQSDDNRVFKNPALKKVRRKRLLLKRHVSVARVTGRDLAPRLSRRRQVKTEPPEELEEEEAEAEAEVEEEVDEIDEVLYCRKCLRVFREPEKHFLHAQTCTGKRERERDPVSEAPSKRPVRNCVKEMPNYDLEYAEEPMLQPPPLQPAPQKLLQLQRHPFQEEVFECRLCCSAFPTMKSRNSHMRIHKFENRLAEPKLPEKSNIIVGLHPNIVKLVQNNPQLSIKSATSSKTVEVVAAPPQRQQAYYPPPPPMVRAKRTNYKCSSCTEVFPDKSSLYFHKKTNCIKEGYECPFCHQRFGSSILYRNHILYKHPE